MFVNSFELLLSCYPSEVVESDRVEFVSVSDFLFSTSFMSLIGFACLHWLKTCVVAFTCSWFADELFGFV